VRNENRAAMFRLWLLDTYGAALLSEGSGMLDVGAGKGELAFQLINLSGKGSDECSRFRISRFCGRQLL
jgi:ubiquinone/menaquinone biosynthesis C-methylase UbiE